MRLTRTPFQYSFQSCLSMHRKRMCIIYGLDKTLVATESEEYIPDKSRSNKMGSKVFLRHQNHIPSNVSHTYRTQGYVRISESPPPGLRDSKKQRRKARADYAVISSRSVGGLFPPRIPPTTWVTSIHWSTPNPLLFFHASCSRWSTSLLCLSEQLGHTWTRDDFYYCRCKSWKHP